MESYLENVCVTKYQFPKLKKVRHFPLVASSSSTFNHLTVPRLPPTGQTPMDYLLRPPDEKTFHQ